MDAPRQAALMFSGGIDSTTAAIRLTREFDRVHLLTWGNGYGHYRLGRTRARMAELKRLYGDRFQHGLGSVQGLFECLVVNDLEGNWRRWGSGFVWCLGCKLAMHAHSVVYCLERGIRTLADGSSQSTGEMVEQMLVSIYRIRDFYARYGIEYRTPVYTVPRSEEIAFLRQEGFRMGLRVGDRFLGVQPKCRPGELYYLPFLLFNQPPKHDPEPITAYLDEKAELAHAWIAEECARRGLALPSDAGSSLDGPEATSSPPACSGRDGDR
jgi:hypothetical protein